MDRHAADKAFNTAAKHPVLGRVCVTDNPEHLIAIYSGEAAGVLFQHKEDKAVTAALHMLQEKQDLPKEIRTFSLSSPFIPRAITDHARNLARAFWTIPGHKREWGWDEMHNEALPLPRRSYAPHCDLRVKTSLITSYALDPELTTEMYQGVYTYAQTQDLVNDFIAAADPEKFKTDMGRIRVGLHQSLLIKAYDIDDNNIARCSPSECQLHSRPAPNGNIRLTHVVRRTG